VENNKKIILITFLAVLVVLVAYRIMHPYRQQTVSELTFTGSGEYRKITNKQYDPEGRARDRSDVLIDFLLTPPEHSGKVYKNIFFQEPYEHKAVLPEPVEPQERNPVENVKADLRQFKVFGFLENSGDTAIFMERGPEILVLRKGDKIDGKYLVDSISRKVITLKAENVNELIYMETF